MSGNIIFSMEVNFLGMETLRFQDNSRNSPANFHDSPFVDELRRQDNLKR